MAIAWVALAVMITCYGINNYLQAIAATRAGTDSNLDPRLLWRLLKDKTYLTGVAFQVVGMLTAFIARRDLPLFLVQASVGVGIVITALLGVALLGWRMPAMEIVLIVVVLIGATALVVSAQPSQAKDPSTGLVIALGASVVLYAAIAHYGARLSAVPSSVLLGAVAGAAFGTSAIASRPLLNAQSLGEFLTDPLLYVFGIHTIAGQLFIGIALQRGATTAASSAMNAMAAIPPAAVGLAFLGDSIKDGMTLIATVGFFATVAATIALAFYARPQNHERGPTRAREKVTT